MSRIHKKGCGILKEYIIPNKDEDYMSYINRIKQSRQNEKDENEYMEYHHIIPNCKGGKRNDDNMIWLYPEEHYYAHKILALENPEDYQLVYAWYCLANAKDENQQRYELSADEYAFAKLHFSEVHSETMKGHPCTEEAREKISKANKGKRRTEEQKAYIRSKAYDRSGEKNPIYGKKRSDDTKKKISETRIARGIGQKKVYCNELDMTFDSLALAAEHLGCNPCIISNCLAGRQKTGYKHPITKEPLHWHWCDTQDNATS